MANRFWVGGSANWDATAGVKWSLTSGGVGGASVPTIGDQAIFDVNSGGAVVTITANLDVGGITVSAGFTGVITSSGGPWTVFLSGAGATSATSNWTADVHVVVGKSSGGVRTSTTKSINFFDRTIRSLEFDGTNTMVCSLTAAVIAETLRVTQCTLCTIQDPTCRAFYSAGTGSVRDISGNGTITVTGNDTHGVAGAVFDIHPTNLTLSGIKNIKFTGAGLKTIRHAAAVVSAWTYWNDSSDASDMIIMGGGTLGTIKDGAQITRRIMLEATKTYTFSPVSFPLECSGKSGVTISLVSTASGTQYTLSWGAGTQNVEFMSIKDCVAAGGATWNANRSINAGNNTGWNFLRSKTGSMMLTGRL